MGRRLLHHPVVASRTLRDGELWVNRALWCGLRPPMLTRQRCVWWHMRFAGKIVKHLVRAALAKVGSLPDTDWQVLLHGWIMTSRILQGSDLRTASIALVIGGMMWGLYWIPVRYFASQGLSGPWSGIAMYTSALIVLSPFLWRERQALVQGWRGLIFSGMFTGAAFSLFTISLVYTDVVRSILLFYLTPVWGTILGMLFLGERLGPTRVLGLLCGLGGMFIVLGGEQSIPWPRNTGDWLALISGITWALGTLGLYRTSGISVPGQVFAFIAGALVLSFCSLPFSMGFENAKDVGQMVVRIGPIALLSALYTLPMIFLTIWPATKLTPARVGLLLMSEVVVGLISAAAFSGEPFGLREFIGATLIVSAAFLEVVRG